MRFAGAPRCVSPRRNYATRLPAARCVPGVCVCVCVNTCRDFDFQMRDYRGDGRLI